MMTILITAIISGMVVHVVWMKKSEKAEAFNALKLEHADFQNMRLQNVISYQDEVATSDVQTIMNLTADIERIEQQRDDALTNVELLLNHFEKVPNGT